MVAIPARNNLVQTGPEDPLPYYFRPLVGHLYHARLRMVLALLGDDHRDRVLELGYGSGILAPELQHRFDTVVGVDTHSMGAAVARALARELVSLRPVVGEALRLPVRDNSFDAVVAVSVLEHIDRVDDAVVEIRRILKPGGVAACGFPVSSLLMTMLFRALGWRDTEGHHVSLAQDIVAALERRLHLERVATLPPAVPVGACLCVACRARGRPEDGS